jgi:hypothetical protein
MAFEAPIGILALDNEIGNTKVLENLIELNKSPRYGDLGRLDVNSPTGYQDNSIV